MPISENQKADLEDIILTSLQNGTRQEQTLVVEYLLTPQDENEEIYAAILKKPKCKQILADILKQGCLSQDLWLKNPVFLARGDINNPPSCEEIADALCQILLQNFITLHSKITNFEAKQSLLYQTIISTFKNSFANISLLKTASQKDGLKKLKKQKDLEIDKKYPPYNITLLSAAVIGRQVETVRWLLQKNANPNCADNTGNTALCWALLTLIPEDISNPQALPKLDQNQLKIIGILLDAGASVEIYNKDIRDSSDLFRTLESFYPKLTEGEIAKKIAANIRTYSQNDLDKIKSIIEKKHISNSEIKEVISILRIRYAEVMLKHEFLDEQITLLEFAVKYQYFDFAKRCIACYPKIISEPSSQQLTSLLTYTLEHAFQSRYTFKDQYLEFAHYLLQNGAKASARDYELLEALYPNIPESLLILTDVSRGFMGLSASPNRQEAEQVQKKLYQKTGLRFEVIVVNDRITLQYTEIVGPEEPSQCLEKIKQNYRPEVAFGISESTDDIGMGWREYKLTVPEEMIPQILKDDFSILRNHQLSQKQRDACPNDAPQKNEAHEIQVDQKEINLLRTRKAAKEACAALQEIMPDEWQLVRTQEGYELHYPIGFAEAKENFDRTKRHLMDQWVGFPVQERKKITARGSYFYELVITAKEMKKIQKQNRADFSHLAYDTSQNVSPLLQYIKLNPKQKDSYVGGWTPLTLAISNGDLDAVKALIDLGVDVNLSTKEPIVPITPIDLAIGRAARAETAAEKEVYKQIFLLLRQQGANFDRDAQQGENDAKAADYFRESFSDWKIAEEQIRGIKFYAKPENVNRDFWTSDRAKICLKRYENALLAFQRCQEMAAVRLMDFDLQVVPNILAALHAIAEDKPLVPEFTSSDLNMFKTFAVSNDPAEFLSKLVNTSKKDMHGAYFFGMIVHYCNDMTLKGTLHAFNQEASPPRIYIKNSDSEDNEQDSSEDFEDDKLQVRAYTQDNKKNNSEDFESDEDAEDDNSQDEHSKETFLENQIAGWKLEIRDTQLDILFKNLKTALNEALSDETQKSEGIIQVIHATDHLIKALETREYGEISSMIQTFRKESFGIGERLWIAWSHFIDALWSLVKQPDSNAQVSNFLFFKPFKEGSVRQEALEVLESLEVKSRRLTAD